MMKQIKKAFASILDRIQMFSHDLICGETKLNFNCYYRLEIKNGYGLKMALHGYKKVISMFCILSLSFMHSIATAGFQQVNHGF